MVMLTECAIAVKRMREKFIFVPVLSLAFDFGALALWQAHEEKACVPHTIVTYLMQEITEWIDCIFVCTLVKQCEVGTCFSSCT